MTTLTLPPRPAFIRAGANRAVHTMTTTIRPAQADDVPHIGALVNRYAAQNVMLPRTEESIAQTLDDWIVAVDPSDPGAPPVVGCGALVPLTATLVEIRSLAVDGSQHGRGLGSRMVLELIEMARARRYAQVCALTLREDFFLRLGFKLVDRWSISSKVWQACIYCPKFHRCDEVAVLMNLAAASSSGDNDEGRRQQGWSPLLKWRAWQPLRLAYQQKPSGDGSSGSSRDDPSPPSTAGGER